jgi:hypothetical protein
MLRATLFLFVSTLAFCAHSFGQTPQWKVIKEFHAFGGSANIPPTVVFTPESNGLYRVSGYFAMFSTVVQDNGWLTKIYWTDQTGLPGSASLALYLNNGDIYTQVGPKIFSPQVGTPVYFVVPPTSPPPMDATYDVAFTIEQLTN